MENIRKLYKKLTKKEVKLFRKHLKKLLSQHGSWAKAWFSEARRLNHKSKHSSIYEIDRIKFLSIVPYSLVRTMTFPIRQSLDYQSISRKIFTVEELSLPYVPVYDTDINIW
jgi:hypothetical protein